MFDTRRIVAIALVCSIAPNLAQAQNSYVKVADEWGTIQPGGPRPPQFGNRNWNIEGSDNGAFTSTGTLRFYIADLITQLDADFPGGWQIDDVTLVVEHDDAAFSFAGAVEIYHVSDDTVAFTNGEDSSFMGSEPDDPPGNFGPLELSPLFFDDTQPAETGGANLGTVTLVNNYTFSFNGTQMDGNLDVFGTVGSVVDPAGAINVTPDYGLSFPTANDPDETLATFTTELAADAGDWIAAGLETIIADIEDGSNALSFIFAPGDATVAATYKGNVFGGLFPPRIYIQASSTDEPGLMGDYNGDLKVDAADYVVWRKNDINGQAGYDLWVENFGEMAVAATAVPEPASLLLTILCLMGIGRMGRRT